MPGRTSNDLV